MKKILNLLNKKQLLFFYFFGAAVLLLSVLEVLTFSLIQPIIGFLSSNNPQLNFNSTFIKKIFPDKFLNTHLILFIFFFIFALRSVVSIGISYIRQSLNRSIDKDISNKIYSQYIHKDYSFFLKKNSSSFISNIIVEVDKFSYRLVDSLTFFIVDVAIVATITIYLLINYLIPSIILIVIITLFFFIFYFFYKNKFKKIGIERSNADALKISWLQKSFYSIQSIKLDNLEYFFKDKFEKEVNRSSESTFKMNFISELPRNLADIILIIVGSSLLYALYFIVGIQKELFLSIIGLFILAMFRILPSANRILYSFNSIKFHYQTINNLDKLINEGENLNDNKKEQEIFLRPIKIKDSIKLENISFSYDLDGVKKKILNNVNLEIKKNKIIGICGKNGSGKSTLLNIITGLLEPDIGSVKLDGNNIKDFKKLYQFTIGYVTQKTYLTDDSVIENIIFGKKREEYNQEQLDSVIDLAQLKSIINQLPNKENTLLGERGVKLSGGQQQRIGIARALYKNPQIIIFDEATSALDSESQEKILLSTVFKKNSEKITIIVSHDKRVFKMCDEVYQVDQGKLTRLNV
jgi:ABC-type bacteriocin/lantibiotic exporter with double-glycine peptidase domain